MHFYPPYLFFRCREDAWCPLDVLWGKTDKKGWVEHLKWTWNVLMCRNKCCCPVLQSNPFLSGLESRVRRVSVLFVCQGQRHQRDTACPPLEVKHSLGGCRTYPLCLSSLQCSPSVWRADHNSSTSMAAQAAMISAQCSLLHQLWDPHPFLSWAFPFILHSPRSPTLPLHCHGPTALSITNQAKFQHFYRQSITASICSCCCCSCSHPSISIWVIWKKFLQHGLFTLAYTAGLYPCLSLYAFVIKAIHSPLIRGQQSTEACSNKDCLVSYLSFQDMTSELGLRFFFL